jgi:hypothetical protein
MVELVESSATMRVTHVEEARMRGDDHQQAGMWSYLSPEQRVPRDHPLRPIPGPAGSTNLHANQSLIEAPRRGR